MYCLTFANINHLITILMKTSALIIAILFCVGLAFTSFAQDKQSILESQQTSQSFDLDKSLLSVDPNATNNDIKKDPLSNYPDPFTRTTTIEFTVWAPTKVSLIVYYETGERVAILVGGDFMHPGNYRVIFDSGELRVGKYVAVLQMGPASIKEEMTKVYSIHSGLPSWE